MDDFIERLKSEIAYVGISRKELAHKAGIKIQRLDNYLYPPLSMPPADVAVKLAHALDITVEYLVTGKNYQIVSLSEDIHTMRRFKKTCENLLSLPKDKAELFEDMIQLAVDKEKRK